MLNDDMIKQAGVFLVWFTPFLTVVIEAVKLTFPNIDKRFLPAIAVVVGVLGGIIVFPFTSLDLYTRVICGGASGFIASRVFQVLRQTKKNAEGGNKNKKK